MKLAAIKRKFDRLLGKLSAPGSTKFSSTVESAYEALVLADVMNEYVRVEGPITNIIAPPSGEFLNQAPGRFRKERAYRLDFASGNSCFFAADIELHGLGGLGGTLFEADVVVIPVRFADDVIAHFNGYPGPPHISSLYECKFGKYSKGHLRELLGLRRHISVLNAHSTSLSAASDTTALYKMKVINAAPPIPIKLVRPRQLAFFDQRTAALFDLDQLKIS